MVGDCGGADGCRRTDVGLTNVAVDDTGPDSVAKGEVGQVGAEG